MDVHVERPDCAECGRPALDPKQHTLAGAPVCGPCLADYMTENGLVVVAGAGR